MRGVGPRNSTYAEESEVVSDFGQSLMVAPVKAMGYYAKTCAAVAALPLKNRVGGFSVASAFRAGFSVSNPFETASQTTVMVTISVSGRSVWPSKDPIGEKGGINQYTACNNDCLTRIDPFGLIGHISVTVYKEDRVDEFMYTERGWSFAAAWTPPTGGDWDKPCECKPCTKVSWFQLATWTGYGVINWHREWGDEWDLAWADQHAFTATCVGSGLPNPVMEDTPNIHGFSLIGYTYWTFEAVSYVKCVAGHDEGTIYASVFWNAEWNTIGDAISSTGYVVFD